MKVKNTLSRFNDNSLPENFVSIAVQVDEQCQPYHAAILIRYENVDYLCHFPGRTPPVIIENFDESGWHIYKIIKAFIETDSSEVGAVLQYCRRICAQSDMIYGYIIDGSCYNDDGTYHSKTGLPEFGTCVGFCLNTLSGILVDIDDSIIEFEDWDDSAVIHDVDVWSRSKAGKKYPSLDWTLYNAFKKRVTPIEYLCMAYFDKYPIKKIKIDRMVSSVLAEVKRTCSAV